MDRLGARQTGPQRIDFGVLLPWVSPGNGQAVVVRVIHEADQFLQGVPALDLELSHGMDPDYGDYWSVSLDLAAVAPSPSPNWGGAGRYLYRYAVRDPRVGVIDWVIDPYAREFGVGKQSAITLDYRPYGWSEDELGWKTPALADLVMYELNLAEYGRSLADAIRRLDYLADLGVTCIQVMPVTNVAAEVDWGYLPIGYFGLDERFGARAEFQRFVDEAHRRGLAVIVDAVYGHASRASFGYSYLYTALRYQENPFMGPFAADLFDDKGASTAWNRDLTRDYFYSVNLHWLEVYHVDGFRYDCVPNFWDGALGRGYADLAYSTHGAVLSKSGSADHWQRFFPGGPCTLIQCAEYLWDPRGILSQSYSTCAWQDETLWAAARCAAGTPGALRDLGLALGAWGYPEEVTTGGDTLPKAPLQYIENHDHSSFLCNFGTENPDQEGANPLFVQGDRARWYKLQPYLIGLLTSKGVPLLWEGQELGQNYAIPPNGLGRTELLRPVRWDLFYDDAGRSLVGLTRRLLALRRRLAQLRRGEHRLFDDDRYLSGGLLLFSRSLGDAFTLVALNVTDTDRGAPFAFPHPGTYREELQGFDLSGVSATEETWLEVPSNYGRIWTHSGPPP